jgi:vacuolar iron transporter family protein
MNSDRHSSECDDRSGIYFPLKYLHSFLQDTESEQALSQQGLLDEKTSPVEAVIPKPALLSPRLISDFTIGLSDGLTVPFALTAGLSALGDARVVVFAGLAELVAGCISMGVAGYLGAKGER